MRRQNAQEGTQDAPGSTEWVEIRSSVGSYGFIEFGPSRAYRSLVIKWTPSMSPHGVIIEKGRTSLCMGVVKGDDAVNWDTERMAREPR